MKFLQSYYAKGILQNCAADLLYRWRDFNLLSVSVQWCAQKLRNWEMVEATGFGQKTVRTGKFVWTQTPNKSNSIRLQLAWLKSMARPFIHNMFSRKSRGQELSPSRKISLSFSKQEKFLWNLKIMNNLQVHLILYFRCKHFTAHSRGCTVT